MEGAGEVPKDYEGFGKVVAIIVEALALKCPKRVVCLAPWSDPEGRKDSS